mmetsp:Transcript_9816/g.21851  ORF Transcript_9816/g.21851 Transcript_9816/m.21851 type:complete len:247 (-) Transcript_9816:908-1648(-)
MCRGRERLSCCLARSSSCFVSCICSWKVSRSRHEDFLCSCSSLRYTVRARISAVISSYRATLAAACPSAAVTCPSSPRSLSSSVPTDWAERSSREDLSSTCSASESICVCRKASLSPFVPNWAPLPCLPYRLSALLLSCASSPRSASRESVLAAKEGSTSPSSSSHAAMAPSTSCSCWPYCPDSALDAVAATPASCRSTSTAEAAFTSSFCSSDFAARLVRKRSRASFTVVTASSSLFSSSCTSPN